MTRSSTFPDPIHSIECKERRDPAQIKQCPPSEEKGTRTLAVIDLCKVLDPEGS